MERYERQLQLTGFGPGKQAALRRARVLVVGAGGLGMPVLQYLAAMGVGTIGIVENDRVTLSNLHRQVLYDTTDARGGGRPKLEAAIAKLSVQNPEVRLIPHPVFLQVENALEIISNYDLVVDGCDNIATRYLINDACVLLGKPFIYGAVFQYEGQVSVCNYRGSATYRCLFPEAPERAAVPNCSESGVLGVLPGIIGSHQAAEAVKVICEIGTPLSNRLLCIDMLAATQVTIRCRPNPLYLQINELAPSYGQSSCDAPERFSGPEVISLQDVQTLLAKGKLLQFLDVREANEKTGFFPEKYLPVNFPPANYLHFPLHKIQHAIPLLSKTIPVITLCTRGIRSLQAADYLVGKGIKDVFSLTGGVQAWKEQAKAGVRTQHALPATGKLSADS